MSEKKFEITESQRQYTVDTLEALGKKIEELERQNKSWSKLSKTQMEMLEENINKNKQLESEIKDYRERLGLRT